MFLTIESCLLKLLEKYELIAYADDILSKMNKDDNPDEEITILVAAYNEENSIFNTLKYIKKQDYRGKINTIVINNNSNDDTVNEIYRAQIELNMNITCIDESKPGKFNA